MLMEDLDDPDTPVSALRDAFGDTKPPEISRKITACVACRKQKVRCHMRESNPPCTRCKKRGLPCTVNKSLQMLLESDVSWKHTMEKKVRKLQLTLEGIVNHAGMPGDLLQHLIEPNGFAETTMSRAGSRTPGGPFGGPDEELVMMNMESGPGAIPGFQISQTSPRQRNTHEDLIDRGLVTLEQARIYFDFYQNRLDHFVYRILGDLSTATLEHVRTTSPLLIAAVCTIGALHLASEDLDCCCREFRSLAAAQCFSKGGSINDVRALCIGAFWLSDMSWALVGAAVRIATNVQLHKSLSKAIQGDNSHYLYARLYLQVYACDHHFSIAFGRPPLTRECEGIRNVRKFLHLDHTTEDDARLVSQVLRWSLCSNVFDTFGVDVDKPLSDDQVPILHQFSSALDELRTEWKDKFVPNAYVGNYPAKGVGLQYHFAKLYLYSHAFRGHRSTQTHARRSEVAIDLEQAATSAISSALSILHAVERDDEVQAYLNGLPIYFGTMIAFAAVFLLKVATRYLTSVRMDVKEVGRSIVALVDVLKRITSTMHSRHLLVEITKKIELLVCRCNLPKEPASMKTFQKLEGIPSGPSMTYTSTDWRVNEDFDLESISDFDFLLSDSMSFPSELLDLGSI